jgi:biotin transport system substrate-specific component
MSMSIAQRPTIVDRFLPKSLVTDFALIIVGVALIAGAAQLVIPMYPVPMTGQTFAVLLVAMSLGFGRATISVGAYVALGAGGLPIFTNHASGWSFGPTLGYLVGFIAAAAVVGWLAQLGWDKTWLRVSAAFLAGSVIIYAFGLPWLAIFLGAVGAPNDLVSVLNAGLVPFIVGDLVKAAAAAALLPAAWAGIGALKK